MKHLFLSLLITFSFSSAIAGTKVEMNTNYGAITLELFDDKAPVTVKNFLSYVNKKYYDGTIFHRVIDNFMIQGGGFNTDLKKKATDAPIDNEAHNGVSNDTGTIAMARTRDIKSATAQFFINVKDNKFLNHKNRSISGYGYAVFGKVIKGMSVINRIKKTKTKAAGGAFANLPVENIVIKSMKKL
jgi:cyclophilin family peptidyl-prolyl cis-trans isomerase